MKRITVKISKLAGIAGVILSSLLSTNSNAQEYRGYTESEERTFFGGIVVGASFSQVDGDNFAGYHKVGFNGGGIMFMRLVDQLAFSTELLYVQKGSRAAPKQLPQVIQATGQRIDKYSIDLQYVEIPLMLNYFDKRNSNFGAGFAYARLLNWSEKALLGNGVTVENTKSFRPNDFTFVLNGNLSIWKGLFANIRFQYSLVPIKKDYDTRFGRAEQFNNQWTMRVGYLF
jgi:hypothetical protein